VATTRPEALLASNRRKPNGQNASSLMSVRSKGARARKRCGFSGGQNRNGIKND
jgi:hypothetical protein